MDPNRAEGKTSLEERAALKPIKKGKKRAHPRFLKHNIFNPLGWAKYHLAEKPFRDSVAIKLTNYKNGNGEYPTKLKTIAKAFYKGAYIRKDQEREEIKDNVEKASYSKYASTYCFLTTSTIETILPAVGLNLVDLIFNGANPSTNFSLLGEVSLANVFEYLFYAGVAYNLGIRFPLAHFWKIRTPGIGVVPGLIQIGKEIDKSKDSIKQKYNHIKQDFLNERDHFFKEMYCEE